jgi:hypothetical protein
LLITQVREGMPGVLPEKTWMSEEIVSGLKTAVRVLCAGTKLVWS